MKAVLHTLIMVAVMVTGSTIVSAQTSLTPQQKADQERLLKQSQQLAQGKPAAAPEASATATPNPKVVAAVEAKQGQNQVESPVRSKKIRNGRLTDADEDNGSDEESGNKTMEPGDIYGNSKMTDSQARKGYAAAPFTVAMLEKRGFIVNGRLLFRELSTEMKEVMVKAIMGSMIRRDSATNRFYFPEVMTPEQGFPEEDFVRYMNKTGRKIHRRSDEGRGRQVQNAREPYQQL